MAVEDVVALLGELRAAEGRIAKARVLGRGLSVLRDLSPRERRNVAVAIAEQAAPDLAPRIQERSGLELDAATLSDIVDLARDLNDDDLEGVVTRLRDPDRRWDAVEQLVEEALVTDEDEEQPPPPSVTAEAHAIGPPPEAVEEPGETAEELGELGSTDDQGADSGEPDEAVTVPSLRQPAPPPPLPAAPPPTPPPEPASDSIRFADVGQAQQEPKDVVSRVRAAGSSLAQLRAVSAAGETIYDLGPEGRLELVRALPDGWVRRRAVHRMLELDVVAARDCLPMVRTFSRSTDRNWVAASMIQGGLIETDDVAGVISDAARERIRRRLVGG